MLSVEINNNQINIKTKNIYLKNLKPIIFYPGQTYNVLDQVAHGEWRIKEINGENIVFCDNFVYYIKEENDMVLLKGEYVNDTDGCLKEVMSFDVLNCEWDCPITNAVYNVPVCYNGSSFVDMESPVKKTRLSKNESVGGADFIVFNDENENKIVFGACTFYEYFTHVNVNQNGYLISSVLTETKNIAPKEKICSDYICIYSTKDDYYQAVDKYTKKVAELMGVKQVKQSLFGYCTWYYYGPNISEQSVLKDIEQVKKHKEIPYQLFQIDDGWFKCRGEFTENEKFSSMQNLSKKIKDSGFIPGIWVSPHAVSKDSDIYKNHKDWLVKTANGDVHPACALDFSHPEVKKWLYDLFFKLTKEYGYEYIKVDLIAPVMCAGKYYDAHFNSLKNYRESMRIIRQAVGQNVFILACTAPIMASVGLADGVRTSVDIFERYSSLLDVFSRSLNRCYLNDNLLVNDPDCVLIRKKENEDEECFRNCIRNDSEIQTYLTAILATGGPIIHSDKLSLLSKEQLDLINSLSINNKFAKCKNFIDESIPSSLDFGRYGEVEVVAFINWGENQTKEFILDKKGYVFDCWGKEFYGYSNGDMKISVCAHCVKLLNVCNGQDIIPLGCEKKLLPKFSAEVIKDGKLKLEKLRSCGGVYVLSNDKLRADNCDIKEISKNVYLVKSLTKNSDYVIIEKANRG